MKTLEDLHNHILKLRSIERIVTSRSFERMYDSSTLNEQEEIERYITNRDRARIENWVERKRAAHYGEMSLMQLRVIARKLSIPYYSRLHKSTLLSEILTYERSRKASV